MEDWTPIRDIVGPLPDLVIGGVDISIPAFGFGLIVGLLSFVWLCMQVVATIKTLLPGNGATKSDIEDLKRLILTNTAPEIGEVDPDRVQPRQEAAERTIRTEPRAARQIARGKLDAGFDELEIRATAKAAAAAQEWRDLATLAQDREPKRALRAWRQAVKLDPTHFWSWIELARLEFSHDANIPATRLALSRAGDTAETEREKSIVLNDLGAIEMASGNLVAARGYYEEDLRIARALSLACPESDEAKRDLSVSLERLGVVEVVSGNLALARDHHQESLEIARVLLKASPKSAEANRDVSFCLNKLGDVESASGNFGDARDHYEEGLRIRQMLSKASPESAEAKRDVSVSLNKLGDVEVASRNFVAARGHHEQGLEIRQALLIASPESAEAKRDVSVSLNKLGDVEVASRNFAGACSYYERSLEIARELSHVSPESAEAKRDLAVSLHKLGFLSGGQSDLISSAKYFGECVSLIRELSSQDVQNLTLQCDLCESLYYLAAVKDCSVLEAEADHILDELKALGVLSFEQMGRIDSACGFKNIIKTKSQ